jgi:outer membrane protein assembly factor BamB
MISQMDAWVARNMKSGCYDSGQVIYKIKNARLRITNFWGCFAIALASCAGQGTVNWPSFRGADSLGVAEGKIVDSWNADPSEGALRNVRWSTEIPGLSHSSPVIWGNRLFITTAISSTGAATLKLSIHDNGAPADDNGEQTWIVYCLDKRTGKILWQRTALKGPPKTRRHTKATHANSTVVTDGHRLIVFFGSEGVYCYDLDGNLQWKKDLGVFDAGPAGYDLQWGTASSPVLFEDRVVLQCDQKRGSFLVTLSAKNGEELWRTSRDGTSSQSWSTPTVVRTSGRTQIVCNGWPYMAGYDWSTGKELWRLKNGGDLPVSTPVFSNGLIYVMSSHSGPTPLFAVRPDASGDITPEGSATISSGLAWYEPHNLSSMVTPLAFGDLLYSLGDNGVFKVFDARTGELRYAQRLGSGLTGFSASPIAVDSRILFASEDGEIYVVKAGAQFELLSKNLMGEMVLATPAVSEDTLYIRTRGHMVAIGK